MSVQLNLQQICSLATQFVQGRTDLTLSEVSLYANIALGQVAAQDQYRSLDATYNFSILSGTTSVALPSDFFAAQSLSVSSGTVNYWNTVLLPTSPEIITSYGTYRAPPKSYAIYGSALLIGPMSDSTYSGSMRYTTKIPTLVNSSDTPGLEDRYHYAVALKTAEIVSASRNDAEQESLNHQRYLDYMGSIYNDRALRQRDKTTGISVPRWQRR